ncbi:MAG: TetR/AcrR family transcriptional regulator [Solirubrobacteraceae bacterium]
MSRRLPRAERRALILDAAGRLFGARGHDATRLDDVAVAAGVTKPILYRHFASKQTLYLAVLARHRDDLPAFTAGMPAEGTLEQRLRSVLAAWFAYVETHAYAWRMLFRDTGGGAEVQAFRDDVHARARAVLAEVIGALAGDRVPAREREPLAELLRMGMASLALWWIDDPKAERDAIVDAMTRTWLGVLSG